LPDAELAIWCRLAVLLVKLRFPQQAWDIERLFDARLVTEKRLFQHHLRIEPASTNAPILTLRFRCPSIPWVQTGTRIELPKRGRSIRKHCEAQLGQRSIRIKTHLQRRTLHTSLPERLMQVCSFLKSTIRNKQHMSDRTRQNSTFVTIDELGKDRISIMDPFAIPL
jgi:hypothetical protein